VRLYTALPASIQRHPPPCAPLSKIRPSRLKYILPASEFEAGFQPIRHGEFKSRRFVSKRTAFFGNTYCLSNFHELARARLPQQNVGLRIFWLHENLKKYGPQNGEINWVLHKKGFGTGKFDAAMRGNPHK